MLNYEIISEDILHFPEAYKNSKDLINFFETTVSISIPEWYFWIADKTSKDEKSHAYGELKRVFEKNVFEETEPIKNKILNYLKIYDNLILECYKQYLDYLGTSKENIEKIVEKTFKQRPKEFTLKKYYLDRELGPHPDWGNDIDGMITIGLYYGQNYSGGVLKFPKIDKSIKLTEGSLVIFPSYFLHESTKVTSGTKYLSTEVLALDVSLLDGRNIYAKS